MQFFLRLYDILRSRPKLYWGFPLIFLAGMLWLGSHITLEEDISGFLPNQGANERLSFVYKNIGIGDEIFVRVSLKGDSTLDEYERVDLLIENAERFTQQLDSGKKEGLIKDIRFRIDTERIMQVTSFLTENMPYFLEETDYTRADSLLDAGQFDTLFHKNRMLLTSLMGSVLQENIVADPFHFSAPVLSRLKSFQLNDYYCIVDDYIFTSDKQHLILFVTSANGGSETARNSLLADLFEKASGQVSPDIQVDYFGAPLVAVANANQIKKDSYLSVALAVLLIVLLLGYFFRSPMPLLLVCVPVVWGASFGLALLYLCKGTVSTIAIAAGSVILGIAVNYAMHYLIHLKYHPHPRTVLRDIVNPMLIGNITTVGAFLSLLCISASAMRDLGLFAAFALIGTILFVLCFMPHWAGNRVGAQKSEWLMHFSDFRMEDKRWLVAAVLVLTVFFSFFSNNVKFETDFNAINFMTPTQRQVYKELSEHTTLGEKSIYHISEGIDLNQALREYESQLPKIRKLQAEGMLTACSGIGSFFPSDSMQRVKIERWNQFKAKYQNQLLLITEREAPKAGFTAGAFIPFQTLWKKEFTVQPSAYFDLLKQQFLKDYIIQKEGRIALISVLYAAPDCAQMVYDRLDGTGKSFVFDAKTVTRRMVDTLSEDFNLVFYICGFLVFFFLVFAFGRIELAGIAFLPMAISWLWILGIMGLFDIRFNIVNIILSTFIFGLGDDYVIFIMDGLMYEYATGRKMLSSYKTSVTLSALTMLIGIGTLIFAVHPAMHSLAEVTLIGMTCVVLIAFVIPPLIFRGIVEKKGHHRIAPVTGRNLLVTVYAFIVFLIGSLYLTLFGYFLLKCGKVTETRKLRFHEALCAASRFVVRYMPGVPSKLINETGQDFSKPSIIICNHQSHIDLMYLLMLSPKIVVLTNKWVWNCPFYGQIIRFADFYPVMNGIENSVDRLKTLTDRGYSIAIFPEGTRSEDCRINRFHRGAFYLAERLKLDLIPVVFHGIGSVLPKQEFMMKKGSVTVKVLPAVLPNDLSLGKGYAERARFMRKYFEEEYAKIVLEAETLAYFEPRVKENYTYKGKDVEKEVTRTLRNRETNERLIASIPVGARLLVANCGVGTFPLCCMLVRKDIEVLGIDMDDEKIAIAQNCQLRLERLQYRTGRPEDLPDDSYDYVIVL